MLQFLVESPYEKKLYRLDGQSFLVGRDRKADIPLMDEAARKRHVRLTRDSTGLSFESLVGQDVLHNGEPARSGPFRVGDRLQIASTTITLRTILAPREKPPPEPGDPDPSEPGSAVALIPPSPSVRIEPEADDTFLAGGLRAVLDINKRLVREKDGRRLLTLVVDAAIDLTGAERGFLLLRTKSGLRVKVAVNAEGDPLIRPESEVSRSIAERAIQTRRPVMSSDAGADEQWSGERSVAEVGVRSVLSVPLVAEDKVLGAFYVDNRLEQGVFTERHVRLLDAFADQAALAIVNLRMQEQMRRREAELRRKNREVEKLAGQLSAELGRAREDLRRRQGELEFRYDYRHIVGRSSGIREVLQVLDKVTDLNVPVFIEGESGTGKELVARALHFNGPRREAAFVTENCSAVPESLIEKVLFGHVKGAFTGADEDAPGLFEQAHGGSLFLDEVGDMSPDMQKKILRVLQEGEVRRVGGKAVMKVDARILCATNRDVDAMKEEGTFREDLFWRLVVVRVRIPPLRRRPEDIPLLVDHFLELFSREMETPRKAIEAAALDALVEYRWPGNVRELGNEMRRAVALAGDRITREVLSDRIRSAIPHPSLDWSGEKTLKQVIEQVERAAIERELLRHAGNKTRCAEALGLSRLGLRNKMERYGF